MNKEEAILEMQKGRKLTHMYFSPWEWVTIKNGEFLFEDGYSIDQETFWADRQSKEWESNWDYYQE